MKFKVEPKDFLLFCIYCGLLLYLCAIAVLNLSSLAQEGRFYGLLPFKAFTGAIASGPNAIAFGPTNS